MQQQFPQGSYPNPYASPATGAQYASAPAGYEFSPQDNEVFSGTGGWMTFAGVVQAIFGFIAAVGTIAAYSQEHDRVARMRSYSYSGYGRYGSYMPSRTVQDNSAAMLIGGLLATALILGLAVLTLRAASGFRSVATTSGNDVPNLMVAMRNLRALYRTVGILIIAYIGLLVLGVVAFATTRGA